MLINGSRSDSMDTRFLRISLPYINCPLAIFEGVTLPIACFKF